MRNYNYGGGPQYRRPGFFGGGFSFFPPVIKTLIISNVVVFLLMMVSGAYSVGGTNLTSIIMRYFALVPLGYGFLPWQLITYLFMHGGFFHLFFNMFILWMFGMELENMWGSKKFFTFYLVCGIGAGLIHLVVGPLFAGVALTIGASGAVYGILLAFAMMFPDRMIFLYFLFPVKAKYFVGFLIIFGLFMGISGTQDGIAHFAHLGGALVAFLYIMAERDRIPLKQWFSGFKRKRSSDNLRYHKGGIEDARYYDIREEQRNRDQKKSEPEIDQERIDAILDKISKTGYQNLTEEEKRILFEASQKLK
jgi:membrane associated rhomboid family serine protease